MPTTLIIEGGNIRDIASFYDEIGRVFGVGRDWGRNLDALNDLLHGGLGALEPGEAAVLVWRGMERNRTDLGREATRAFLRARAERQGGLDPDLTARDLAGPDAGSGPTFFDIVQEIVADHPRIELVAG